ILSPHSAEAYAIGVLVATIVQFGCSLPLLRGHGQSLVFSLAWRNPHVIRVLKLMVPVTIGLGLINFNLTLDLSIATLVPGGHADAYLNYAFRMFMLPQGLFSVAVSAVLFPRISGLAARGDIHGLAHHSPHSARREKRRLRPPFPRGRAHDPVPAPAGGGRLDRARRADHTRALPALELH